MIGMRSDIGKLRTRTQGYLLVTSITAPNCMKENFEHLEKYLTGVQWRDVKEFRFSTHNENGDEGEFWIAAWPVAKAVSPSALAA